MPQQISLRIDNKQKQLLIFFTQNTTFIFFLPKNIEKKLFLVYTIYCLEKAPIAQLDRAFGYGPKG